MINHAIIFLCGVCLGFILGYIIRGIFDKSRYIKIETELEKVAIFSSILLYLYESYKKNKLSKYDLWFIEQIKQLKPKETFEAKINETEK